MKAPDIYASQDFMIGKALSDDEFRKTVAGYMRTLKGLCPQRQKLIDYLSSDDYEWGQMVQRCGIPTTAFAIDLWNRYDAKRISEETLRKRNAT